MNNCEHDFLWSDLHNGFVCVKCFCALTAEKKQRSLKCANALRKMGENAAKQKVEEITK